MPRWDPTRPVVHGASRYRRHKCRCEVCCHAANEDQKRFPSYKGRKRYGADRRGLAPATRLEATMPALLRADDVSVVVAVEMAAAAVPYCPRGTALEELVAIAYLNPGPPEHVAHVLRLDVERRHKRWSPETDFEAVSLDGSAGTIPA